MSLAQRLRRMRERRAARALGQRAALGLVGTFDVSRLPVGRPPDAPATSCPECGRPGVIELFDIPAGRGDLRCQRCSGSWEVSLDAAHPASH